jgi:hypothetical protein
MLFRGRQLSLTNENGQASSAWIDWPGHIWTSLNEGAVYSPDGFTIQFNNGSVWILLEPTPIPGSNRDTNQSDPPVTEQYIALLNCRTRLRAARSRAAIVALASTATAYDFSMPCSPRCGLSHCDLGHYRPIHVDADIEQAQGGLINRPLHLDEISDPRSRYSR